MSAPPPVSVEPNSFVTVEYVLKNDQGEVLDASSEEGSGPIEYVHGYGMLVPGLEAALAGLTPGTKKEISISAEEGFGERDEDLMLEVGLDEFPDPATVAPDDEFVAESDDGEALIMRVVEVLADAVRVDANHPLAGLRLHYSIEVKSVRAATDDEIEEAASELDEAHEHVHGPDCDHSHDPIVPLSGLGSKGKGPTGEPS